MATFPAAIKNFLQLQDGVDRVIALHPNERGDEITSIETLVGALGSDQSYSESFKNLLLAYRRGCSVDYKSASDLYVRSGEITIPDASGNVRLRRNTSDTTVTWANLDTGSEANSTVYYVYAVADSSGTTFTVKISTNATTPSGCTYYKKIGTFYNNSSGNIEEVSNLGTYNGFGNWVTKTVETVYLAATDGEVHAYVHDSPDLIIYTDGSNPPTTIRARSKDGTGSYEASSVSVRKGDYWKVSTSGTVDAVYWIPKGV